MSVLTLPHNRALLGRADPLAPLRVGLVASWPLDEASGPRKDHAGTNDLTSNNSVGQAAGPGSFQAASFVAASAQYLSAANTAALQTGNLDFTLAFWVYLNATGTTRDCWARYAGGTSGEYLVRYNGGANRFEVLWVANGSANQTLTHNATIPTAATWYFLRAWVDTGANTVNVQVNADAVTSATKTVTLAATTQPLTLGDRAGGAGNHHDGRLALGNFWKRTLSAAEHAQLYAGGAGLRLAA